MAAQYTAGVYTWALEAAGLRQSMGRVATCFDNAACENFSTLKTSWLTPAPGRLAGPPAIEESIEVLYNCWRRHSVLDYLSLPTTRGGITSSSPLPSLPPSHLVWGEPGQPGKLRAPLHVVDQPPEPRWIFVDVAKIDQVFEGFRFNPGLVEPVESKLWGTREFMLEAADGHRFGIGHGE